jgi:L-ribulose-5-phosphate 4-epimerase
MMAIKPSGVSYDHMMPHQMVYVEIESGEIISNGWRVDFIPSVDTPTHLEIYRRFPSIGGIAHTHSPYATVFAQNCRVIPSVGTTHADAFNGSVPVTRSLTEKEIAEGLERWTGIVIAECFQSDIPAVLVRHHGPFTFGRNAREAVDTALILEKVAFLALYTGTTLDTLMPRPLATAHYQRKHGSGASYGQQ